MALYRRCFVFLAVIVAAFSLVLPGLRAAAPSAAAAGASIQLSRTTAAPVDGVTVTGYGFKPGDTVVVSTDMIVQGTAKRIQAPATADGKGSFSLTIAIPRGTAPGTYTITARDFHNDSASQALQVLRLVVVQAGSKPSTFNVIAGHRFYVRGSGFQPGATVSLTMSFPLYSGNALTENRSAVANQKGAFGEVLMRAPSDAKQGGVTLSATGSTKGLKGQASVNVIYRPRTVLGSTVAPPGSAVTIKGVGFVAGTTVHVSVVIPRTGNTTVTLSKDVTADQNGAFTTSLSLPGNVSPGTYSIAAVDAVGGFKALTPLKVSIHPALSIKPGTAAPGQDVTVSGGGFSANASVGLSATFPLYGGGSRTVTVTAHTNGSGAFSTRLAVPASAAASTVAVTAQGPNGRANAQLRTQAVQARIIASPATAAPGSAITVSGSGYLGGARIEVSVTVKLTNGKIQTLSAAATTNSHGQFSARLQIPANAVGGSYTIVGKSELSGRAPTTRLVLSRLAPSIVAAPATAVPGTQVAIRGTGYAPGAKVTISIPVRLTDGKTQTLAAATTANGSGQIAATVRIPANAAGGTYTVVGQSANGRAPTTRLVIGKLAPSIVSVPTMAVPGTRVTVNGFGFAPGQTITVSLQGQKVGTATTNAAGRFSLPVTVPASLASGAYTLSAASSAGRGANLTLTVNRKVATHFYFASEYTGRGYHEYLALLNPTDIRARVTIIYQRTNGSTLVKNVSLNAHTRATEDVNADLGVHVSAAAEVSADVAIVASRFVYHGTDEAVVPGVTSPSTIWYFANGNTGHGYREYIAVQNPDTEPVQVAVHFLPTHHRAFTVYRTMPATSRTTFNVNSYVHKDAVGVTLTANGPVVANRTIFIHHGIASKIGVTSLQHRWYFAAGPRTPAARNWIAVINPSNHASRVTLHIYGPMGGEVKTVTGRLKPRARVGYLMNRIAHRTDVAVVLTAARPVVAEQTTYAGRMHNASTDTFGDTALAKSWSFADADTMSSVGAGDMLSLFNPNLVPVPIVVQFMNSAGQVVERTYVVAPLAHRWIDVSSVEPNQQLGIVAASNYPFVALNRGTINHGLGADTSQGIAG